MSERFQKWILFSFLIFFASLFFFKPIDFINTDLPRHLKNGQVVLETKSIPKTNLYSYTYPEFPTVMHHWGAGVIFYFIQSNYGFVGLHLFAIVLYLTTLSVLFFFSLKHWPWQIILFLGTLSTIIISPRTQVRPELFSYLLFSIFLVILWQYCFYKLKKKYLLILPLLQVFWVNLHVFFVFGLALVGLFWLGEIIYLLKERNQGVKAKWLSVVLVGTTIASIINPFGLEGILSPFTVVTEIQQFVVENLDMFTYLRYFSARPQLLFLLVAVVLWILLWVLGKNLKQQELIVVGLMLLVFSLLPIKMVRTVVLFGLILIPTGSLLVKKWLETLDKKNQLLQLQRLIFVSVIIMVVGLILKSIQHPITSWFTLGIDSKSNEPAEFLLENNIQGPILNNFNSGSYLAYHLYPKVGTYIDGRAEAYPNDFFYNDYIPLEHNPEAWGEINKKYAFNLIFAEISANQTEWVEFLTARKNDPKWALIYQDSKAVIFILRTERNQKVIEEFEIVY